MWVCRVQGQAAETRGSQGPPDSASSCGCWGATLGNGLERTEASPVRSPGVLVPAARLGGTACKGARDRARTPAEGKSPASGSLSLQRVQGSWHSDHWQWMASGLTAALLGAMSRCAALCWPPCPRTDRRGPCLLAHTPLESESGQQRGSPCGTCGRKWGNSLGRLRPGQTASRPPTSEGRTIPVLTRSQEAESRP